MKRFLVALAPITATVATLGVMTGTANAQNVVAAVHQQDLRVGASGEVQHVLHLEKTERHDPSKLYHALDSLAGEFAHSAKVVSRSSASSTRQRHGRHDWAYATRELSESLYKLGHAFHLVAEHRTGPTADRLILAAEKQADKSERLGLTADRLLGVSSFRR